MHRLRRVRYWLWLPDDAPSANLVRGVLAGIGFRDLETQERYRFYGPWRWQETTQASLAHWCEEVRHYVEPFGGYLVDVQVSNNGPHAVENRDCSAWTPPRRLAP